MSEALAIKAEVERRANESDDELFRRLALLRSIPPLIERIIPWEPISVKGGFVIRQGGNSWTRYPCLDLLEEEVAKAICEEANKMARWDLFDEKIFKEMRPVEMALIQKIRHAQTEKRNLTAAP